MELDELTQQLIESRQKTDRWMRVLLPLICGFGGAAIVIAVLA